MLKLMKKIHWELLNIKIPPLAQIWAANWWRLGEYQHVVCLILYSSPKVSCWMLPESVNSIGFWFHEAKFFFWLCGYSRQSPYGYLPCHRRINLFQQIFNTTFKLPELSVSRFAWAQLFLKWHLIPQYFLFLKGIWGQLNLLASTLCNAVQAAFVKYCAVARRGCKITIFQC